MPEAPPVEFHRLAITVRQRPIADAQGRAPTFPADASGHAVTFPLTIGATIYHWAAPRPADAWAAIAYALLHDTKAINDLSASHDAAAQYGYMQRICEAIRNYYNCLNIVWWNDPIARACYRKWIAGLPFLVNGQSRLSVFDNRKNYGGAYGWYVPDYEPAVLYSTLTVPTAGDGTPLDPTLGARPPAGILPRLTRTLFDRFYPVAAHITNNTAYYHRVLYVPSVGFSLKVVHGTETLFQGQAGTVGSNDFRSLSVEVSDNVENTFWLNFQSRAGCPDGVNAFPVLCGLNPTAEGAGVQAVRSLMGWGGGVLPFASGGRVFGPDGNPATHDDWFNFRFLQATTEVNPNVELPAAIGAAEYLPWLREWMAAVVQRTAEDAILDSRAFVVYQNFEMVRAANGVTNLMRAILTTNDDIIQQQTSHSPQLESAAQAAFAIGGALAPATYGISALVGGAIGAGLMVADSAWIKPVAGHGKDDLGRWKPVFDRAWLSGDATTEDLTRGPPLYSVPAPPSIAAPAHDGTRSIGFIGVIIPGVTPAPPTSITIPPALVSPPAGTPGYVGGVQGGGGGKSRLPWVAAAIAAAAAAWKFTRK